MPALLAMLAAFTLVWVYLLIRRYQLARLEWQLEEDAPSARGGRAPGRRIGRREHDRE